jgi:hypothetical protein
MAALHGTLRQFALTESLRCHRPPMTM